MEEKIFLKSYTVETFKNTLGVQHLPFYAKKDKYYADPTTGELTDVPVLLSWNAVTEDFVSSHPELPIARTKDNTPLVIVRMAYEVAKDVAINGHPSDERPLQVIEVQQDAGTLLSLCYAPKPAFMA